MDDLTAVARITQILISIAGTLVGAGVVWGLLKGRLKAISELLASLYKRQDKSESRHEALAERVTRVEEQARAAREGHERIERRLDAMTDRLERRIQDLGDTVMDALAKRKND